MIMRAAVFFAVAFVSISTAQAVVVTTLPDGTSFPIPPNNEGTAGPRTIAPGITWSSEAPYSVYGWTGGYGFSANGSWSGLSMIGSNDGSSAMTIAFDTPVAGVGGFLNYAPGYGIATISAYNGTDLVEALTLSFLTGGGTNSGEYLYFLETASIITSFVLEGAYIGFANLKV